MKYQHRRKAPDCRACKAFPDHNPQRGTCALGHDFVSFKRMPFPRKAYGTCVTKCYTEAQQTHYLIELGKDPAYIPRQPRKLRGI